MKRITVSILLISFAACGESAVAERVAATRSAATCKKGVADAPLAATNAWTQLALPGAAPGDDCQSILVDPVNPGSLYTACGRNDGRKIRWYATADYGSSWTLANGTTMAGNPWGFSIDPNPNRDPCTPPTIYSPAGYGSFGAWKSIDGAASWARLGGADTAFQPYNPYGPTDLYHVAVLPDDPPNHVLATYHYSFKGSSDGGFGETWDGGSTWAIHRPPPGIGTSHYVLPISATTWLVIAQSNGGANGMWRTTTAGRVGGTPGSKYRDGTIGVGAWSKVSSIEHTHGSYTPVAIGSAWYSPGLTSSESSIWRSIDDGATWTDLQPGYYWAAPPNPAFSNKNVSGLAATANYIYGNYFLGPQLARAPTAGPTHWMRNYVAAPTGLSGAGSNPMGTAATLHPSGHWMVFMATNVGVWRYIEP